MIYILVGPDDFSISQRLEEIKQGMGDQTMLLANFNQFAGEKVSPAELKATVETVPFLASKRLVLVTGLLGRFEPAGSKKPPAVVRGNEGQLFAESLAQVPESTLLVLADGRASVRNPLLKALAARAEVSHFPQLKGDQLKQWVNRRVAQAGGSIAPAAVGLLAGLVGSNLWTMAGEIEKLALFARGRRIEEADVRTLVASAQDTSVFTLVDAILEPDAARAEKLLQQMMRAGAAAAYLLYMLHRQLHLIIRAREMNSRGRPEAEIRSQLGINADFAFRKTLEQARRYPLARLKAAFERLLETDLAIKTGKYDGELALNILVAELGRSGAAG
ncbi:MAG: DNA polymerase III subunit delta [Chloroflexota bacterium]